MWTSQNRGRYDRSALRDPSNLTDEEWALAEPLIPPAKRGGNRRHVDVGEVVNGLMGVLSTGCQWRALPKVCRRARWSMVISMVELGRHARSHPRRALCEMPRGRSRAASPTAAIIDSQSVKSAEKDPMRVDGGLTW